MILAISQIDIFDYRVVKAFVVLLLGESHTSFTPGSHLSRILVALQLLVVVQEGPCRATSGPTLLPRENQSELYLGAPRPF